MDIDTDRRFFAAADPGRGGGPGRRLADAALVLAGHRFSGLHDAAPFLVEQALSQPLRRLATVMSTFLLETLGYPGPGRGQRHSARRRAAEGGRCLQRSGHAGDLLHPVDGPGHAAEREAGSKRSGIVGCAIPIAVLANVRAHHGDRAWPR